MTTEDWGCVQRFQQGITYISPDDFEKFTKTGKLLGKIIEANSKQSVNDVKSEVQLFKMGLTQTTTKQSDFSYSLVP